MTDFLEEIDLVPLLDFYDELDIPVIFINDGNKMLILENMDEVENFCRGLPEELLEYALEIRKLAHDYELMRDFEEIMENLMRLDSAETVEATMSVSLKYDETGLHSLPLCRLSPKDKTIYSPPPLISLDQAWTMFKFLIEDGKMETAECVSLLQEMKQMGIPLDRKAIDSHLAQQPPSALENFEEFNRRATAEALEIITKAIRQNNGSEKQLTTTAVKNETPDLDSIPEINSRPPNGIN
ncbi:hypothetical protein KKC32_04575 [Patescibacteria group bacterium]|nr:hypothetical protein [Patescibacteria group bacterium]